MRRRHFVRLLLAALGSAMVGRTGNGSNNIVDSPTSRKLFAHYMVCCPMAGHQSSEQDFVAEIKQAFNHGIDGFALNCGAWSRENIYPILTERIFSAAARAEISFKLFFSADGLSVQDTVEMVSKYYDHPTYFRCNDLPVLSTFGGDAAWGKAVINDLSLLGKPIFFVPYFFPATKHELPDIKDVEQVYKDTSFADGYFYFGAAGTGFSLANVMRAIGNRWTRAGKIFMASVTPFYRGLGANYRIFESDGFSGVAVQWEAAIESGAQWIEIVTWNDWGESTYVASFGDVRTTQLWNNHWGPLLSHAAYLTASQYYIRWFKTGVKRIDRDELFWFYRLSSKTQGAPSQVGGLTKTFPAGANRLKDSVFCTIFLTAPAVLEVFTGQNHYKFDLTAGIHHCSADFSYGKQLFLLHRNEKTIFHEEATFPITDNNWSNFNYFSGQASPSNN